MSKLTHVNIAIGFCAIFVAACGGIFIANDMTFYVAEQKTNYLNSWSLLMLKSAHGHTNLFGMLHIVFGLTLNHSTLSINFKKLQTIGLSLGTLAMSMGMLLQSFSKPTTDITFLGIAMGVMLTGTLVALGFHIFGVFQKIVRI